LILPSYVFNDKDLHKVVIIGEVVAVGALVMCMSFVFVDLGRPLQFWHLIPGIGQLNFPSSLLSWDILVLNGYLALNALVPAYIVYCHYHGREPVGKYYKPFVFISIGWAVAIHMVTAFLYQGLPARPFWNNPLMGPRFLASAFAAGPAIISLVLHIVNSATDYKIDSKIFNKLRIIIVSAAIINLLMLFSEVFKEFYFPTHHSQSATTNNHYLMQIFIVKDVRRQNQHDGCSRDPYKKCKIGNIKSPGNNVRHIGGCQTQFKLNKVAIYPGQHQADKSTEIKLVSKRP